jgi:hypothetical protein
MKFLECIEGLHLVAGVGGFVEKRYCRYVFVWLQRRLFARITILRLAYYHGAVVAVHLAKAIPCGAAVMAQIFPDALSK